MNGDRWQQLEIERATLCRQTSPTMSVTELASYYNIERAVVEMLFGEVTEPVQRRRKNNHADRAIAYAKNNVGATITTSQLCTELDASTPTVLKIVEARADVFRKIRRGIYEIRDPHQDRKAEKEG